MSFNPLSVRVMIVEPMNANAAGGVNVVLNRVPHPDMMVPAQVQDALSRVMLHATMRCSMRVLHVLVTSGGGISVHAVGSKIAKFPVRPISSEHGCH
jgi:hypothetical protein